MREFCRQIITYLETSRAYKNPDLSLWHISTATGIPVATISQSINRYLKQNFFDLINRMRLEEAKQMLCSEEGNSLTIESVANCCGFRSRSTFYLVFNKFVGTSPLKWLRSDSNTNN